MSTLDELRIGGIRNFGSEIDEQQKIQFSAPLTLIVGANGCGKTTIIECIKYALTGEYPPNSNSGQNFINDPKQNGLTEVRGFVKLRVKNVNEGTTTISRGAKITVKGQKMQMKSEDSILLMNVRGEPITLNKRKDEATDLICNVMGVSKAVINYVLFCHQEESDWPLWSDMEVMNRFDKIFGTTEYNNAVDKMRKTKKELENDVKDKKVGLKELEMIKKQVDTKKIELDNYQRQLARKLEEQEICERAIEPLQREVNSILEIEQNLGKLVAERTKIETEYKNKKENRQKLLSNIKTRLDDTIDEIETKIRLFKSKNSSKEHELSRSQGDLDRENARAEAINRKAQDVDRELAGLFAQSQQEQDTYDEKARYIREMCEQLNIAITFDLGNDNQRAEEIAKRAEAGVADEETKVDELQRSHDRVQTEHENRITELRNKKISIETALEGNREHLKQIVDEVAQLNQAIAQIEKGASKQKELEKKIEQLQKAYDDPTTIAAIDTMQEQIMVNHTRSAELNVEIERLDEQIGALSKSAAVLAQVNAKEKQLEKYDNDIRRIRNKHASELAELLNGEEIEKNYKQRVEQENQRLRSDIDRREREARVKDNQLSECVHSHKSKKQELSRLEAKLREMDDKIYESCQSVPFAEVLAESKENAAKAQMEHSALQSAKAFYQDYIDKMRKKPCCPLCHKDFNGNEADDLKDELNGQIDSLPSKIQRAERAFKETNDKYETLLALQPAVESVASMRDETIPALKRELDDIDKKRSLIQAEKTKLEKSLEQPKQRLEIGQTMVGDLSLLDDSLREAERIRCDLHQLKQTLPETGFTSMSLDEAQAKRKVLSDDKKKLDGETRQAEMKLKAKEDHRNRMQKCLFEMKEQAMKFKEGVRSLDEKRSQIRDLNKKVAELNEKKRDLETSLAPTQTELKQAIETKDLEKSKNAKQLKEEQMKLSELKLKANSLNRCRAELRKFAALKLDHKINENEKKLTDLKRQKNELKTAIEAIQERIDTLKKEIADQGALERNLQDNLDLLELEREMEQMESKLKDLRRNEGDIDFEEQSRTKRRLQEEISRKTGKRIQIGGETIVIQENIKKLEKELNEPQQKNAVQNYRRAFYEKVVLEKMIVDFQTYCDTLERALTKYHSEKMAKINRLIRELWRSIYKGNDIDYIEINTEEMKSTSKKRSYTYRVVQSKNDTKNAMRGNCSAGQRVLACLVIRIALAETFSANCGVLALDEPTTNLDRVNIGSLVEELRRFIDERENQQNFMLLVITHDEEFIQMLGRSGSYQRVSRNASGKSVITKLRTR